MMKVKFTLLILGILVSSRSVCNKFSRMSCDYVLYSYICYVHLQHLMISGGAAVTARVPSENIEAQLEKEIGSLKNESAEGSFNDPTSEPCKQILYRL